MRHIDLIDLKHVYHMDVVNAMEQYEDDEEVLVSLRNFESDCLEVYGEFWTANQAFLTNENEMEQYAWDMIRCEKMSSSMMGYIDIKKYLRDVKLGMFQFTLDGRDFFGETF